VILEVTLTALVSHNTKALTMIFNKATSAEIQ
jgi:hypothetical protein